jgi:hypothetical protein
VFADYAQRAAQAPDEIGVSREDETSPRVNAKGRSGR